MLVFRRFWRLIYFHGQRRAGATHGVAGTSPPFALASMAPMHRMRPGKMPALRSSMPKFPLYFSHRRRAPTIVIRRYRPPTPSRLNTRPARHRPNGAGQMITAEATRRLHCWPYHSAARVSLRAICTTRCAGDDFSACRRIYHFPRRAARRVSTQYFFHVRPHT